MPNTTMNPLIALIIGEIAKQLPALALDILEVIKSEGTPADWAALRARWDKPAADFYKTPAKPE